MAIERVLVDTGPLVALLVPEDLHHGACAECVRGIRPPLLTSWAVITESAWLLRHEQGGLPSLLQLLVDGTVQCLGLDADAPLSLAETARKYATLAPQLADLTLLYLARRERIRTIFTIDRRDFNVYRDSNGQPFDLLPATL